jgi:catechol-2,3-dioxygenase
MAKLRHIALTTANPSEVAEFYKRAFEMQEIRRSENGAVFLSDGYINLAILNHKTEKDADVGPDGPNYNGIHHIGFQVENLESASEKLDRVHGVALNRRHALEMVSEGPRNVEMKWAGPDKVVIDISESGWATS